MFLQPYQPHELRFGYCYLVYLRWRTRRSLPRAPLAGLDRAVLERLLRQYQIRVLECASDVTDLLATVSLQPTETISGCASKLKGRVSKRLRERLELKQPADLLSKGYFACTTGKSTREAVEQYLDQQSEHHGYAQRVLPPTYTGLYEMSHDDINRISPKHAFVVAQFHIVLAAFRRRGVFGSEEARQVATEWLRRQSELRMALTKVSFVPDHVHIAVRTHPAVAPADVVVALMNAAQEIMARELVHAGLKRLWQPSAYVGGYGDLASLQMRKYIENWKAAL